MEILVDTGVLLRAFDKSSSEQRLILLALPQNSWVKSSNIPIMEAIELVA